MPPKLERTAIGPTLSATIRGKPEVDHLRKLVAATATTEDLLNAIVWCDEAIEKEAYADWGAPDEQGRWIASRTPRLALTSDLILLRATLNLMATEKAPESPFPVCTEDKTCLSCYVPVEKRIKNARLPLTGDTVAALALADTSPRHPFYTCDQCKNKSKEDTERLIGELTLFPQQRDMIALSHALTSEFPVPLPDGLEMFPFQRASVEYSQDKNFVLLADDMGVGKTIQAIGILNAHPDPGRILVICPATLKGNWKNEIQKWSTRPYEITIVSAGKKVVPDAHVTIINYDLLGKRELNGTFDTVICDEAHALRNIGTNRTEFTLPLLKAAKLRFILTGTPIVTSPYDLWPVLSVSGLPLAEGYLSRYVVETPREMDNGYGKTIEIAPKRRGINQDELQSKLRATCMVRRLKSEVLPQLPPKTLQIITIPDAGGKELPKDVILRVSRLLESDDDYRRCAFANGGDNEIDGGISRLRHEQAIIKVPHVSRHIHAILDGDETSKVVVFAHHTDVIHELHKKLDKFFPVVITGATPSNKRTEIVAKFQTDQKHRVFIGNIHAAGEGITLHAAALAVFAELDWQFAKVAQAEDRLHRIGQLNPVLIQHIVLENSIDSMIVRAMVAKQSEAKKVVG